MKEDMKDITVKELTVKMTELAKTYPNAIIALPDTKKGKVRRLAKGIWWQSKEFIAMDFNTYRGEE